MIVRVVAGHGERGWDRKFDLNTPRGMENMGRFITLALSNNFLDSGRKVVVVEVKDNVG
jgi:hypothetical protein